MVLRQPGRRLQQEDLDRGRHHHHAEDPGRARSADLDKIKAKGTKDALYLPGQDWYGFDGFLLDAGADLVKKDGDKYTGNLDTPQAASAIDLYKKLNSYGTAPKDKDEATPQQSDVFAKGDVGAFIGLGWEAGGAITKNSALKDQIGYFAVPGQDRGQDRQRLRRRLQPGDHRRAARTRSWPRTS